MMTWLLFIHTSYAALDLSKLSMKFDQKALKKIEASRKSELMEETQVKIDGYRYQKLKFRGEVFFQDILAPELSAKDCFAAPKGEPSENIKIEEGPKREMKVSSIHLDLLVNECERKVSWSMINSRLLKRKFEAQRHREQLDREKGLEANADQNIKRIKGHSSDE